MNYSKPIIQFVDNLIHHHAEYDRFSERYELAYTSLNSFDIDALAGLFLEKDKDLAAESTSPDNPLYLKTMLPALIEFMKDSDKDNLHAFADKWKKSIISYQENSLKEILSERIDHFNRSRDLPATYSNQYMRA